MGVDFSNPGLFESIARRAAERYPFKHFDVRLLALSENATYLVYDPESGEKLCVMRVGRPGYHTLEEYESEISWLRQINDYTPLIVANPIEASDGSYIQTVEDAENDISFYCMATDFLPGETLDHDDDPQLMVKHYKTIGETTAYLHRQTEIWNKAKDLKRWHWDYENLIGEHALWGNWRDYPGMGEKAKEEINECCKIIKHRLDCYGKTPENYGIIHADLRAANIIVEGDRIKVIDFDDFGFGWHVHDLAGALSGIETEDNVPDLVNAWIEGYSKVLPFRDTDFAEIDTFILQRRIQLMAWMSSHQDSSATQGYMVGCLEGTLELADRYLRLFG